MMSNPKSTRLSVAACVAVLCAATNLAGAKQTSEIGIEVEQYAPDRILLHYELGEHTSIPVTIDGIVYEQFVFEGEPLSKIAGAPDLPRVCRSIVIPEDAEMAVRVAARHYYDVEDVNVAPSKGILSRTIDPASVPYTFGDVYQTDAFYPATIAEQGEPYIMRDLRGMAVTLNPMQYNPVTRTLRVYTEVTLEVVRVGAAVTNALVDRPEEISLAFHQIYKHRFLNYDAGRYNPLDETGEMLIICYDAWLPNIQPLVDHKNAIGITTTAVGVATIGNNSTAIKSYIQSYYNSHDLAFVLLVGDSSQVATPSASGGSSDPSYALLAGSDNYPDILVGRFSAQSTGDVDTQVLRTIEYELLPATQQAWFKKGVGIGSSEGSGIGDDGESDTQHITNIRTDLLAYDYTLVDGLYGYPSASQVAAAVNGGRGIINYCGHGSTTTWVTSGFSNTNVNALTNDNELPFIFSVACVNGNFDGYTCFAEAWLRATHGSEPTGAIGMYASSINQDWAPPMAAQDEAVDLLCEEAYYSFGALCFAGSCQMMDEYGSSGVNMFNTWLIFGDPSVRVFGTAEPPRLTMTLADALPDVIAPGAATTLTVQILDGEETYVPGSGTLHYRFDGGAFQSATAIAAGGDLYEMTLPAVNCDDEPEFYFSASGDAGAVIYLPADAPASVYSAIVGVAAVLVDDPIESDFGWTVGAAGDTATTGIWGRMDPVATAAQPGDDHTTNGTICWVTDGRGGSLGDYDVDGGKTTLLTPIMDLSETADPLISYWRWYSNDQGGSPNADVFKVAVSSNGGGAWTDVETVGPTGPETSGGWFYHEFRVADFVAPTVQVQLRFIAEDAGSGSIVEAAIDDFRVDDFTCEDENPCQGDLDGDDDIDLSDLAQLLSHYGETSGAVYEDGDIDGDGDVDLSDLAALLSVYGVSCN